MNLSEECLYMYLVSFVYMHLTHKIEHFRKFPFCKFEEIQTRGFQSHLKFFTNIQVALNCLRIFLTLQTFS